MGVKFLSQGNVRPSSGIEPRTSQSISSVVYYLYMPCMSIMKVVIIVNDLSLGISPSINSLSVGAVMGSSSTQTVTSSSMVVTKSNTDSYMVTSTTTQLLICSQTITTSGTLV